MQARPFREALTQFGRKFSKTFTTWLFPISDDIRAIAEGWITYLRDQKLWGGDDPLFPATAVVNGTSLKFEVAGLARRHWSNAGPIRAIFRDAFRLAGLMYFNPHSFRKTLAQLGERVCRTPEELKAWSQNLAHEDVLTTLRSYGEVPSTRQAEIIKRPRDNVLHRIWENAMLDRKNAINEMGWAWAFQRGQRHCPWRGVPVARPRAQRRAGSRLRALGEPQSVAMGPDRGPGHHCSGKTQITGNLLPFSHQLAEETLSSIEPIGANVRKEAANFARSTGHNPNDRVINQATDINEILASASFMFSNLWLDDALRQALNPVLPQIQNTDGEPLEFITLHFALISGSSRASIIAALDGLPVMRKENDSFWNWVEEKPRRKPAKKKAADVQVFGTTMEDGAVVLGNIELTAKEVTLSVNSEGRASRGRALLEPVLAGLVKAPLVERQTVEQMMASRKPSATRDSVRLPPNEERAIVHQSLTDHYRTTLDEPIPSLDDQSPRLAAKSAKGRKKVIAWLKMLENHSARQGPHNPMGSYDFTWMWEELGLADERR